MIPYASREELAEFVSADDLPDGGDAARLIASASRLVESSTRHDRYDVDPAGKPTDPFVIGAFRDATCLQAAYWASNGLDPAKGATGVAPRLKSSGVDGATVTYESSGVTVTEASDSMSSLIPAAFDALRNEGFASGLVG